MVAFRSARREGQFGATFDDGSQHHWPIFNVAFDNHVTDNYFFPLGGPGLPGPVGT